MAIYLAAVAPILLGNLVIPPISHYEGEERHPPSWNFLLQYLTPERNKELSMKNIARIEQLLVKRSTPIYCYQHITHMFVHRDNYHLETNLIGIYLCSYPVFNAFGAFGLHLTYIVSGYVASIPSPLYEEVFNAQQEYNIESFESYSSLKYALPHLAIFVPQSILSWIDRKISRSAASFILKKIDIMIYGASGSIYALIGNNFAFFLRDSYRLLDASQSLMKVPTASEKKVCILPYIISFLSTCYLVWYFDHVDEKFFQKRKDVAIIYDRTDHACQIQGSLFGMAMGIIFGTVIPWFKG